MLTSTEILWVFQAFVAATAVLLLMGDGQLLEKYRVWLEKRHFEWRAGWIAKPLGLCDRCFTGQVCLWSGVVLFWGADWQELILKALLFAAFGIFFNEVKNKVLNGAN